MDYKERLEKAKELYPTANTDQRYVLECLFPELKESEDERIRKSIISGLKYLETELGWDAVGDVDILDAYAWLEKQGEQKSQRMVSAEAKEALYDKPATIDIDKMVYDYTNNKERGNEEFGKPVNCMIRAYRQGLNDAVEKIILKPVWSEEDETGWTNTMIMIKEVASNHYTKDSVKLVIDWLKSIKQRIKGE